MRKVLFVLLILAVVAFAASSKTQGFLTSNDLFQRSICDKPVAYRIGDIDARFGLSIDKVSEDLANAEAVWEKPTGRNLFEYDSTAELKVNFVYDKKQALNKEINQLEGQLNAGRGDLEAKKADYEKQVAEFNKQVDDLNSEIASWNSRGGAPKEEYEKITAKQNELKDFAKRLNEIAKNLNLSAQEYNLGVGKLNQSISEFNADLARRPEEGLYSGETQTIDIYFVPSQKELEHTLAHELGHALGLGHVESNPKAIMFPYSSEITATSTDDINAVNELCVKRSLPEAVFGNFSLILQKNFKKQTD